MGGASTRASIKSSLKYFVIYKQYCLYWFPYMNVILIWLMWIYVYRTTHQGTIFLIWYNFYGQTNWYLWVSMNFLIYLIFGRKNNFFLITKNFNFKTFIHDPFKFHKSYIIHTKFMIITSCISVYEGTKYMTKEK